MGQAVSLWHKATTVLTLASVALSTRLMADDSVPAQQVVPIPGPQAYSQPHPVDAIVTDSDGNLHEQTYTYHPNYYPQDADHPNPNVVIINNTQQVTSNGCDTACPSIFFPLFSLGFIFAGGYWCGYNGLYWNGYGYSRVRYNGWNRHWRG